MVSRRTVLAAAGGFAGGYLGFAPSSPVEVEFNASNVPVNAGEIAPDDNSTETSSSSDAQSGGVPVDKMRRAIHKHTNSARISKGESGLKWDDRIAEVAQSFAERMANEGFYSHTGPDGSDPEGRMQAAGLDCYAGENIDKTYWRTTLEPAYQGDLTTYLDTAEKLGKSVVGEWMHSQGHRENLLRPRNVAEGIGVALNSENAVYVVQDFCDENPR